MTVWDVRDQEYVDALEQVIRDLRASSWVPQWFENILQYTGLFNDLYLPFLLSHPQVMNTPLSQQTFWLPTADQFEVMRQAWWRYPAADIGRYSLERNRCTSFAFNFASFCQVFFGINSIGVALDTGTALHAFNIVVLADRLADGLLFFEPEGSIWVKLADTGLYQLKRGAIIL